MTIEALSGPHVGIDGDGDEDCGCGEKDDALGIVRTPLPSAAVPSTASASTTEVGQSV